MPREKKSTVRPREYEPNNRTLVEEEARVRSKFANERTFGAWVRTGLSLVVVGLAVGQFLAQESGLELYFLLFGGGFVLAGVGLFWYAAVEYLQNRKEMKRAQFHAPRKSLVGMSVVLSALSLGLLVVIAVGVFTGA